MIGSIMMQLGMLQASELPNAELHSCHLHCDDAVALHGHKPVDKQTSHLCRWLCL